MIKTLVVHANDDGTETPLGWCAFGQMPINVPPRIAGAPEQAQPQPAPVMCSFGGKSYIIMGYRWQCPALDEADKFNLPEAYLYLVVRTLEAIQKAQATQQLGLVRAPAAALDRLPLTNRN